MIHKDKCVACNKRDTALVEYGGWYYHQTCLDKLLAGVIPLDAETKQRLSKAFNNVLTKEGRKC